MLVSETSFYFGLPWHCIFSVVLINIAFLNIMQGSFNDECIQSNFNSSNTDGSFAIANSNSFLSPYEILPIAQENKY